MNYYEWQNVMPARKRRTQSEVKRVRETIAAYLQANPEMSYKAVGELFGYSETGIKHIAVYAGLPLRGPQRHPELYPEIIDYIQANPEMSYKAIGEWFGYSDTSIARIALKAGLPSRGERHPELYQEIIAYARANPALTSEKLGLHFNLTGSRISQILLDAGISGAERVAERTRPEMEAVVDYAKAHPEQSWGEIAKAFDISPSQAKRHADRAGYVKPYPERRGKWDYEVVAAYYTEHPEMTLREISDHFGMSPAYLLRILRETGMPRRGYEGRVMRPRGLGRKSPGGKRAEVKAEVIEYLREFPELSQMEIAEALGLTQSMVSRYGAQAGLGRHDRTVPGGHHRPYMGVDKEAELRSPQIEQDWGTQWGYRNPQPRWNIAKHRWE